MGEATYPYEGKVIWVTGSHHDAHTVPANPLCHA